MNNLGSRSIPRTWWPRTRRPANSCSAIATRTRCRRRSMRSGVPWWWLSTIVPHMAERPKSGAAGAGIAREAGFRRYHGHGAG